MVKFNFSSVFLTLTAASALVFALPTPDENTATNVLALTKSEGQLFFREDHDLFGYFKEGSNFVGVRGKVDQDVPISFIKPATYRYNDIKDFKGRFRGVVGPKAALIKLVDNPHITINGPLDHEIDGTIQVTGFFDEE